MKNILPWQHDAWQAFMERPAQAWLLHGAAGIGKLMFAQAAVQALLCEDPQQDHSACGVCQACIWHRAGNHPDFCQICPEALDPNLTTVDEETPASPKSGKSKAPSKDIRIDQIRALQERIAVAPFRGQRRVVLLYPADALNLAAANALLKTLEEPPPGTLFLLITDRPAQLLPTIISRCRKLPMPVPTLAQSLAWLEAQQVEHAQTRLCAMGGAPLSVLRAQADDISWMQNSVRVLLQPAALQPIEQAEQWADVPLIQVVDTLQKVVFDLCLYQATQHIRYFPEQLESFQKLSKQASLDALSGFARLLTHDKQVANHPLNARLFLLDLLMRYRAIFSTPISESISL